MINLKLGHGWVAVKAKTRDYLEEDGLIIPTTDTQVIEPNGEVIAVGDYGAYDNAFENLMVKIGLVKNPIWVKQGDKVMFNPSKAIQRVSNGENFYLVHYTSIEASFV